MKENLTLEKKQQQEFDNIIGQYIFHVEYNGLKSENSSVLNVEKRGIRLHFLRFGLFDDGVDYCENTSVYAPDAAAYYKSLFLDEQNQPQVGKVVKQKPQPSKKEEQHYQEPTYLLDDVIISTSVGFPKLNNFHVARTPLRKGYVYMINDNDPVNDFKEFEVDDFGMFKEVDWSKNKKNGTYLDVRKAKGEARLVEIIDSNNQTYCFGFSPVQWNVAYVNKVLTDANLRSEVCKTKVLCKGMEKNKESDDIALTHYKNTNIVFPKEHPIAYKYQDLLHSISVNERNQEQSGDNQLWEDMFITLDDPIGAADDICFSIDREITKLKAIIISLQTGKPVKDIFPVLYAEKAINIDTIENSNQIIYLHRLAQITYDFVYNNHNNAKKYSSNLINNTLANLVIESNPISSLARYFFEQNGVDKTKLEKLLAVKERKEQRDVINSYRDDLGNVMISDYYQNAKKNYFNGIEDVKEEAKEKTAEHFIVLGNYPNIQIGI